MTNPTSGEECDDGMPPQAGDGCDAVCQLEFPPVCQQGVDPITGDPWVVCAADANQAWISHFDPAGGNFHAELICNSLGYTTLGMIGGTCGNECGYCEQPTSCMAPGMQTFDGAGECGMDMNGIILCFTVQWQCLNP
ncbi:MAG: hypothetical protein KDK70_26345 [Myxococcales bacterium]|nr:hypothetical protein [Myxococcales bacterium]